MNGIRFYGRYSAFRLILTDCPAPNFTVNFHRPAMVSAAVARYRPGVSVVVIVVVPIIGAIPGISITGRDFHGTDIDQLLVGSFSELENDVVRAILDGARGSKNGKSVFADFLLLDDLELVVATGAQEQTQNQKKRTSMNHFIAL
jgi:hypothetical protein